MKRLILLTLSMLLIANGALAQAPVVDPGWSAFVIREGSTEPPFIVDNDDYVINAVEIGTTQGGQKAGLATDLINGAKISQITGLHIDRLDDVGASGSLYGPYFNIWVTDGLGNYAVLANEPSDAEWAGSPWDVADWNFLKTKRCKVYEVPGSGGGEPGTSWVATYTGLATGLIFDDVADLIISPPPPAYIANPLNAVGSGAPDEILTNIAHGYNWIFGDTSTNYVSGGDGFIVNNYTATATFSVQNVTQATSYATIEAALAAANSGDSITIDDGTYNPPSTLNINQPLTITGQSEAGVIINIAAAGGYGMIIESGDVTLSNFTLATNVANTNFPIHASGTGNPPNGYDNLTLQNITVQGVHQRTGFDIHGFNTVVLSFLTSSDATGGNGFQVTGCVGVVANNLTSANNAWGSFAVYASKPIYLNRGSSNVVIDGASSSFGEGNIYSQDEFGLFNTSVSVTGYDFIVRNDNAIPGYDLFHPDEPTAIAVALNIDASLAGSYITAAAGGTLVVGAGMGIQFAFDGAFPGDTVEIRSGTFAAAGQLVLNKDLTVTGAGAASTVVVPTANTAAGSYLVSSAFIYVDYGVTAIIEDLSIDGTGFTVVDAIQCRGADFTVRNCEIRNIYGGLYNGKGIQFLTGVGAVENCVMSGIQRIGVHIRGNIEPTAPDVNVDGFTYTGKGVGDFLDYGVEFGGGSTGTVNDATIINCVGVAASDGSTSAGILVTDFYGTGTVADITNSSLTGNTTGLVVGYDVSDISQVTIHTSTIANNADSGVTSTGVTVDATNNWWGTALGPFHPVLNAPGTGNLVSDNVLFEPWVGMATAAITPSTSGPIGCSQTVTLTFSFTADGSTPDVFLYNAIISATAGLDFGAIVDLEPFGTVNNNFFAFATGANEWTITGSTVGSPTSPVVGPGTFDLFTITFSATSDVLANVDFTSLVLRDPNNDTIPVSVTGAAIEYDCTAPAAVTTISAAPGHNKVDVAWTHSGTDVDHYEVFSGVWHDGANASAYPEYDDLAGNTIPAAPADYVTAVASAEWLPLVSSAATAQTETWSDHLNRGVYYYTVFAVDAAGNASAAPAVLDRATNYWLGDVDGTVPGSFVPDGTVGVFDISALGTAFATSDGDAAYSNIVDVGPTDNMSRLGIPTTDDLINFEDLIIFSLNFGVVTSAKSKVPDSKVVNFAWVSYDDGSMALRLVSGTSLKGLRLQGNINVADVAAGPLVDEQSELVFLKNVGIKLDANLAIMGFDKAFAGNGDLIVVRAENAIDMANIHITARGTDNSEL
ncbi:MAG: hypothetical protein ACI8S7_000782, partial [Candidatus Krumholzibacteriia bacterium]